MIKTWTSHLKIANYLLLIVVLFLAGCASAPGPVNVKGEAVSDIYSVFTNGEIRLTCNSPSCAGGFGSIRREAKIFYDNGLWKDLVYAVAGVGYKEDLAYFYLGAAAENLGYLDAAQTYYRLADTVHKCDGWLNNCDGFDIPALLSQARIRIPQTVQPEDVASNNKNKLISPISADPSRASLFYNQQPIYPTESRIANEQGQVLISVLVNADGTPQKVAVFKSSGYIRLDDAALTAVIKWRFLPANKNGQPIESRVIVPIKFSLKSE